MNGRKLKILAVMFFLVGVTVFSGCKKKTTTGSEVTVNPAAVVLAFLYEDMSEVILVSNPVADTAHSQAKINSRVFPIEGVAPGYLMFIDTVMPVPGTSYKIEVTSDVGNSSGSAILPETTSIIAPEYGDTNLPLGQAVTCSWVASAGAQYYIVQYSGYAYTDSDYVECPSKQLYPTANGITIPASYFNVPGAICYSVALEVIPCSGAKPEAGQTANMTGTINGFLSAQGYPSHVYFYVGTPTKGIVKEKFAMPSRKDIINTYLRDLGINTVVE
ncbi:MAG: hypothetical protein WC614_09210 [bacterium]